MTWMEKTQILRFHKFCAFPVFEAVPLDGTVQPFNRLKGWSINLNGEFVSAKNLAIRTVDELNEQSSTPEEQIGISSDSNINKLGIKHSYYVASVRLFNGLKA
jgi:hypothetical protein